MVAITRTQRNKSSVRTGGSSIVKVLGDVPPARVCFSNLLV